jgi:hypothetical protein
VINDDANGYLWEVPRNGNIVKLAGNGILGSPTVGQTANTSSYSSDLWGSSRFIAIHPTSNDIFVSGSNGCAQPIRLDRITGLWQSVVPTCGTHFWLADGMTSSYSEWYGWSFLGFDNDGRLYGNAWTFNGTISVNNMVKSFDITTGTQNHYMGPLGAFTGDFSVDGTDMTSGHFPHFPNQIGTYWDSANSRWLASSPWNNQIRVIPSVAGDAGSISTLTTTNNVLFSFSYRLEAGNPVIYYCATNGRIYRRDVIGATETAITWPSPTISCTGRSMSMNTNLNRLEFIFTQNGLYGIGEIQLDPP